MIKKLIKIKRLYNLYLDRSDEIMKNTQFKVEDQFGVILNKDSISRKQIAKLNNFSAKIM